MGKSPWIQSTGVVFFAEEKGNGDPPGTFSLSRTESQPPDVAGLNLVGATSLAVYISSQGLRGEPGGTEPPPMVPGGILVGSNPVGPQALVTIAGNATGPVGGGPSAALATASSSLPAQPGRVLDVGGPVERLWAAGAARERTVLGGALPPDGTLAVPIRYPALATSHHWSLRPAPVAVVPATEGREEGDAPRGADLIAEALPFDRASLEAALDQFVHQLDELDLRRLAARGPAPLVVFVLTALSSAASMEIARRFWRRRLLVAKGIGVGHPVVREIPLGFPELPGSWSERVR
jgi:hypothetical protein